MGCFNNNVSGGQLSLRVGRHGWLSQLWHGWVGQVVNLGTDALQITLPPSSTTARGWI